MSVNAKEASKDLPTPQPTSIRWWIPAILLPLMLLLKLLPDLIENGPAQIWMASAFGPLLISLVLFLWWGFFSRSSWRERLLAAVGFVWVTGTVVLLAHPTMKEVPPVITTTIPLATAGFALGMILFARSTTQTRVTAALIATLLFSGITLSLRTLGVWGDFGIDTAWRWEETADERIQASLSQGSKTEVSQETQDALKTALKSPQWSGFRGNQMDGRQPDSVYSGKTAPKELWRIGVGPAWSSFAVADSFLITQEQRGDQEALVCYDANSGQQVWTASWDSRFFEALGGLGPRATPTLSDGSVYAQGAAGQLLKVDGATGEILWQKDIMKMSGRTELPMWGYSSSPCVDQQRVYVYAAGDESQRGMIAFDKESGETAWTAEAGVQSYSSPQLVTIEGRTWLVLLSEKGAHFYEPETGKRTDYPWPYQGYRALQPQVLAGDQFLIPTGQGMGTRLIQIKGTPLEFTELWTTTDLKPDFNDLAIHKEHIYGFDSAYLTCIDAKTGERAWKGKRYGKGQLVLLPAAGVILVASEKGKLAAVEANPDEFIELWEIDSLDGKTWNHPVVVGDRLYVRNASEAVAYQLPGGLVSTEADLSPPDNAAPDNGKAAETETKRSDDH